MGNLIFNGQSLADLGFVIQTYPSYEIPDKNVEVKTIPGRNGSIIRDTETYRETVRTYKIAAAIPENKTYIDIGRSVAEWLMTAKGYKRLTDTYDPLVYRMARYSDAIELPNLWDQATGATIQFVCKPQRYLLTGEASVSLSGHAGSWVEVENPTKFPASPEFTLTLSSTASTTLDFYAGSTSNPTYASDVVISGVSGEIHILSDAMECYNSLGLINDKVTIHAGFPTLYPGKNYIKYPSNVTAISMVPRWWTL